MKSRWTRAWAVAALVALWVPVVARAAEEDTDGKALVSKVVAAIPKNPFSAKLTLSSSDFAPREMRMSRKYVDGAHGSYLEVTAPDELEGIRFLFLERANQPNEQYIKVKASRNPVRVQEGVRTQPFLGSAFYVSDLVLPEVDNFTYKYLGKNVVGGRSVTLVEMTPKDPDKEVYAKTVLALDPKDLLILRREFFDKNGDKVKVWTIDKVEQVDGIWTLTGQEMQDLKNDSKSRLDVSEVKYNAELPDVMFTPKYLTR
ncbi:MAG TPA: outer membrane lipoprotein-sorting protein [Candidatus Dormibacteraeota bacterium]|nr:outer membrane lipoprotein-sorting protein [Candidatus Dormibacteraeota bacterium]